MLSDNFIQYLVTVGIATVGWNGYQQYLRWQGWSNELYTLIWADIQT